MLLKTVGKLKQNPMKSGIKPTTFWFVAQRHNQLHYSLCTCSYSKHTLAGRNPFTQAQIGKCE
jgi:hypothetical protein